MDRPAFQFYVKDWTSNQKLRRCSEAARGAWIYILCFLHDSEEYGIARFPLAELAKAAGVTLKSAKELVAKKVLKGGDQGIEAFVHTPKHAGKSLPQVTLIEASTGPVWYSSRMVKDEWARARRGASTRFGDDNPPPLKRQGDEPKPTPTHPPTHAVGGRQGDGAAVAVAVAVESINRFPGDRNSPASPSPREAVPAEPPTSTPEAAAKIIAECTRAGIADPANDGIVQRWIRKGYTPSQVIRATAEAPMGKDAPKPMTSAYVDPILKRNVENDRRAREASERRVQETIDTVAEGIARKATAVAPPTGLIEEQLRKARAA